MINMALIPAFGGYALFWLVHQVLPRTKGGVVAATAIAAFAVGGGRIARVHDRVRLGGNEAVPVATVAAAMVGVHVFIGIGEAVISALTVGAVMGVRPDLVYGAADLRPRSPALQGCGVRSQRTRWFILGGLALALALAFGASRYASSQPDGLEKVAAENGLDSDEKPYALTDGPFADYETRGIQRSRSAHWGGRRRRGRDHVRSGWRSRMDRGAPAAQRASGDHGRRMSDGIATRRSRAASNPTIRSCTGSRRG